jgi:amino acid transporter
MSRWQQLKQVLIGRPIATKHAHHERLPKRYGLAVFASDALSSVAYATEEVLLVLVMLGAMPFIGGGPAYDLLLPIAVALGILLLVVVFSYFQTIHAYPEGGGSYYVSSRNLGFFWGKIAGSALLMDYVLTVAVSVAAGSAALVSAFSGLQPYIVHIAVGAVLLLTFMNLRGAKESGAIFAVPTYSFVLGVFFLIGAAVYQAVFMGKGAVPPDPEALRKSAEHAPKYISDLAAWAPALFILKAFSASCTALTGVEAVSDGVQAFRKPEARNASQTLMLMAGLLLVMFVGVSWSAHHFGIMPLHTGDEGYRTVMAQLAAAVFGDGSFMFFFIQFATMAILFLAANTAFADFPRLGSFIAKDGFLPRFLMNLGDRLVFNNGIILLAGLAIALVIGFRADTHNLIPLYAVGVFTAFTLSQSGMVAYFIKRQIRDWRMYVSLFGAVICGVVTVILAVLKWAEGAWVTIFAVAFVMSVFWLVKKHYLDNRDALALEPTDVVPTRKTVALMLVPRMHKGILETIAYARSLAQDVRGLHVTIDPKRVTEFKEDWNRLGLDLPMVILESPYRSLVDPILDYIDATLEEDPDLMVTVIVPEAIPKKWWHRLLHNNAALWIKRALGQRKRVVVTNVRYFID